MKAKILQVVPLASRRAGGPPAFVGPVARELTRLGHHVRVVTTDLAFAPGASGQRALPTEELHPAIADVDHAIYPARWPRRLAYSPALRRALLESVSDFDVVHIHSLWLYPQYSGFKAASETRTPYIVSPHGALDPFLRRRGRLRKRLTTALWQRRMLEGAQVIHVTTDLEAELIQDVAPDVPRVVVPLGIDLDEFRDLPPREEFRRERLGAYDGPLTLFLGRLTFKKGLDILIQAFSQIGQDQRGRLVIAGPDDEDLTGSLRGLAERCGVLDDVVFVGPVYGRSRQAALASADLWVLPSHTENFGVAVIEAMAAGLPVVISPAVNIAPQIADAHAGLIAALSPEAFAQCVGELLADAVRRRELGAAAQKFATAFEWASIAPSLVGLYHRALAGS